MKNKLNNSFAIFVGGNLKNRPSVMGGNEFIGKRQIKKINSDFSMKEQKKTWGLFSNAN